MRLFWKISCGGFFTGLGMAAVWTTASWPGTTAAECPASVRSAWT
jgi:hypothetical protein